MQIRLRKLKIKPLSTNPQLTN